MAWDALAVKNAEIQQQENMRKLYCGNMVFSPIARVCKGAMCPSKLWFIVWSKYILHPVSYYILLFKKWRQHDWGLFVLMQNPEMFNSDHAWLEKQLLNADRVTLEWQSPQHSRMTHRRTVGSRWMHQRHWPETISMGLWCWNPQGSFLNVLADFDPFVRRHKCFQPSIIIITTIYIYTQYVFIYFKQTDG